jgi:hypothetical protein
MGVDDAGPVRDRPWSVSAWSRPDGGVTVPGARSRRSRWAAVLAALPVIGLLGLAGSGPADAAAPLPVVTPDNTVRTLTITAPGTTTGLAFSAATGRTLTVELVDSTMAGTPTLELRRPDGTLFASRKARLTFLAPGIPIRVLWVPPALDVTGRWRLVLRPDRTDTSGTGTLALLATFANAPVTALAPGASATMTLARTGLVQVYRVSTPVGRHPTLTATKAQWTSAISAFPGMHADLYHPDGVWWSDFEEVCGSCGGKWGEARTSERTDRAGPWWLLFRSGSDSVGMMTFTLRMVADQVKAVTPGPTSLTSAVKVRGQNLRYTLPATAGARLTMTVQSEAWAGTGAGGGRAEARLLRPDGTFFDLFDTSGLPPPPTPYSFTFAPFDAGGQWILEFDPQNDTLGGHTVVLTVG